MILHICCAPCGGGCVERLQDRGETPVLYYSNSNLDSPEEFERRLDSARILARAENTEIIEDRRDHGDWLEKVAKGLEDEPERGARCARCFLYSLGRAAEYAASHGFDAVASSLTVSPHKSSEAVFAAGEAAVKSRGGGKTAFLREDFKKRNGENRSQELAEQYGLYRQLYCGCEFSLHRREEGDKKET